MIDYMRGHLLIMFLLYVLFEALLHIWRNWRKNR